MHTHTVVATYAADSDMLEVAVVGDDRRATRGHPFDVMIAFDVMIEPTPVVLHR